MAQLVFWAEGKARRCFFAHFGVARDDTMPCGYATVDEDPDPNAVCHLRMMLVEPSAQRKGVGLALLKHVVAHFGTRHLGLKYAKCHDYHALYTAAGFKRIGDDANFVYMALKRG